jgi:uncharacterized protein YndB with AHSA1/START domain
MTEYATALTEDTVRIERDLPGPIEKVWAYLTESDKRATWLARGPMDLRKGGKVELTWENGKLSNDDTAPPARFADKPEHSLTGRVLEVDPPRLLSFQWGGDTDSIATFELTPKGSRVQLVITHSRLSDRSGKVGVSGGWHSHLGILEDVLEGKSPRPFWKNFTRLEAEYEKRY